MLVFQVDVNVCLITSEGAEFYSSPAYVPQLQYYYGKVMADKIRNNHLGVYKQPCSPQCLCDYKNCMCIPDWLNNLEPVTSHLETEGAAQSDFAQFHLPQL